MLGVRGKALSDRAHYEAAIGLLEESVANARRCGDVRQAAWSLAIIGRARLLRGQLPDAAELLDDSLALVAAEGWVAFQPFPEALRAEVALRQGDPEHRRRAARSRVRARLPDRRPLLGGDRRPRTRVGS